MQYIIGGLILLFVLKLAFDFIASQRRLAGKKNGKGQIIDISDKWINIDSLPYRRKDRLFTPAELLMYHELRDALAGSPYAVVAKIPLSEIVNVPGSTENRQEYIRRASEKCLDLVICEIPDFRPLVVVLLEEGSISRKQQLADIFTEKALSASGYAFMRINVNETPDLSKLLSSLKKLGVHL